MSQNINQKVLQARVTRCEVNQVPYIKERQKKSADVAFSESLKNVECANGFI
jgi:hypothetical protein